MSRRMWSNAWRWRLRTAWMLLGVTLTLGGALGVVQAAPLSATISYSFPAGEQVYPEGIAYHAGTGDIFVGSTNGGAIYRINPGRGERVLQPFLPAGGDGRSFVTGLKVDAKGRLWVSGAASGQIWVYDAVTGRLLISFANGTANTFLNDIAITPDGTAYITDSGQPFMYRVITDPQGQLQFDTWLSFAGSAVAYQAGTNLNGIVASPDGRYLVAVQTNTGKLFRIEISSKTVSEIGLNGETLIGGDGLVLDGQTLYVVRNRFNLVDTLTLAADFATGTVTGSFGDPSFAFPTTAVKVGNQLLLPNAQFNRRQSNNPGLPFSVSSVSIPTARPAAVTYPFPAGEQIFPEGIAYHAGTGDIFVGSTNGGAIYRINPGRGERTLTPFLPAGGDGRTGVVGMKVNPQGQLFVAGGNSGTIWMYDAVTGRLLSSFATGISPSFINDVVIAPDGAAYFTDTANPSIYRIKADAQGVFRYELWRDLRNTAVVYGPGANLNGIVASPDGKYLVLVQTNTGKLFRVDIGTKELSEVNLAGASLAFGDGLLLDGAMLYVVRNRLNLVTSVRLAPDFASGTVVGSVSDPSFRFVTTVAKVGDRLVLPNAQFDRRGGTPELPFSISSVPLP